MSSIDETSQEKNESSIKCQNALLFLKTVASEYDLIRCIKLLPRLIEDYYYILQETIKPLLTYHCAKNHHTEIYYLLHCIIDMNKDAAQNKP